MEAEGDIELAERLRRFCEEASYQGSVPLAEVNQDFSPARRSEAARTRPAATYVALRAGDGGEAVFRSLPATWVRPFGSFLRVLR